MGTAAARTIPVQLLASSSQTKESKSTSPPPTLNPDPKMEMFRREEEKIIRIRKSISSKRIRRKIDSSKEANKKKRKRDFEIPGLKSPSLIELGSEQEQQYINASREAYETTERWIHQ